MKKRYPLLLLSAAALLIGVIWHDRNSHEPYSQILSESPQSVSVSPMQESPLPLQPELQQTDTQQDITPALPFEPVSEPLSENPLDHIGQIITATPFDVSEQDILVAIARGYFQPRIINEDHPYFYETNINFLTTMAESGDTDAINILLYRLNPYIQQANQQLATDHAIPSEVTDVMTREQPYFEPFYFDDPQAQLSKYNQTIITAAAHGKTAALQYILDPQWTSNRLLHIEAINYAARLDGDAYADNLADYLHQQNNTSAREFLAVQQEGENLYKQIQTERKRLNIPPDTIITLKNVAEWQEKQNTP